MKIINTKSGKAYQLVPETQLEIEKTNPFLTIMVSNLCR